jgi:hypothetical protein
MTCGQEALADEPAAPRWREVWTGADATETGWLLYSGMTIAPTGGIHEQGLRFRLASGYGGYSYSGPRGPEEEIISFEAQTGFTDFLGGYLWRLDPVILKVFAGASAISHEITPFDEENLAIGLDWGPKGVIEVWLNMGDGMWGSLDLGYSGAHETGSARSRIGYRLQPKLSVGLEGRINVDAQGACDLGWTRSEACQAQTHDITESKDILDFSRAGAFVRYEWDGGEVSAALGVSGAMLGRGGGEEANPYVTINWIKQF